MKIGITFNLKSGGPKNPGVADDAEEEFDSPETIHALADVLHKRGHAVALLGDGREFLERILAERPDFVFNFAEGTGVSRSREARVPAVLDMLGIPYTGSDPYTMAVALDKDCAKKIVAAAGVAVPFSYALDADAPLASVPAAALKFPLVVKPAWEGSSKGIRGASLVKDASELPDAVEPLRRAHRQTLLLEEYIEGDEVTVGLLGNGTPQILGIMRVSPNFAVERFIYSLEVKREYKKLVTYECPPPFAPETLEAIAGAARTAFRALACRDVARVDFRMRGGVPYFLEVNPLPGLNPDDSDLVIMAGLVGWSYDRLVGTIVDEALKRHQGPRQE